MPASRINMRKLKDALRLKFEGGQSHQQIATVLGISKGVVTRLCCTNRIQRGMTPAPDALIPQPPPQQFQAGPAG